MGDLGVRTEGCVRGEGWKVGRGWFSFPTGEGRNLAPPFGDEGGVCRDWKKDAGTVVGLLPSGEREDAESEVGEGLDWLEAWVELRTGKLRPTEVGVEAKLVLMGEVEARGMAE